MPQFSASACGNDFLWAIRTSSNKTVVLNGINVRVGVMPEGINYPKSAEVYAPLAITQS